MNDVKNIVCCVSTWWTCGCHFSEGRQVGVTEEVTFKLGHERPRGRDTPGLFQEMKEGHCGWGVSEGEGGGAKIIEKIFRAHVSWRLYAMFKFGLYN